MNKGREGRDEPILDPSIPIIDAHHHLFVRPGVRYLLDEYVDDVTAGHRIIGSVYVETQAFVRSDGPEALRPLGEVEFANGIGAMSASGALVDARLCAAIIGYADLRLGDGVAQLLDRCLQAAPDRFRGVRQITLEHSSDEPFKFMPTRPPIGILQHSQFRNAFKHLVTRRLIYDAAVFSHQLSELAVLADAFPDATITLNHMGMAMGLGMNDAHRSELFAQWRAALRDLARRPNVICKVGGLGLPFWGFGFHDRLDPIGYLELANAWRPYVETAIEAFGPQRCMAESNFPPDGRSCGFVPLWNALKHITAGMSATDKAALFCETAARVHRIVLPTADAGG